MDNTINGRTPEEIKKGLGLCIGNSEISEMYCERCPYIPDASCRDALEIDALALIQQLERERDAAVRDLESGICCATCAHCDTDAKEPPCATCRDAYAHGNWQWRGVQEVE